MDSHGLSQSQESKVGDCGRGCVGMEVSMLDLDSSQEIVCRHFDGFDPLLDVLLTQYPLLWKSSGIRVEMDH